MVPIRLIVVLAFGFIGCGPETPVKAPEPQAEAIADAVAPVPTPPSAPPEQAVQPKGVCRVVEYYSGGDVAKWWEVQSDAEGRPTRARKGGFRSIPGDNLGDAPWTDTWKYEGERLVRWQREDEVPKSFTYDANGKLTGYSDNYGKHSLTFDSSGRPATGKYAGMGGMAVSVRYSYGTASDVVGPQVWGNGDVYFGESERVITFPGSTPERQFRMTCDWVGDALNACSFEGSRTEFVRSCM